jgi:hypothetical protein
MRWQTKSGGYSVLYIYIIPVSYTIHTIEKENRFKRNQSILMNPKREGFGNGI